MTYCFVELLSDAPTPPLFLHLTLTFRPQHTPTKDNVSLFIDLLIELNDPQAPISPNYTSLCSFLLDSLRDFL